MRLLILAPQPFYQNRGTPIAVRLLAEVLGQSGVEVHLLVFHEGENVVLPNVTIHRIPSLPGISRIAPGFSAKKIIADILLWAVSIKLQRAFRFDLVHAVEESVFIAWFNQLFFRVPFVYDMDSCLSDQLVSKLTLLKSLRRFFEWFENRAIRESLGVVAVCKALERNVRQLDPEKPLVRLEDISLLQECPKAGEGESLRQTLAITGKIVLYVGNLERYQGIDLLLSGFALLACRHAECMLVIIGGSPEDRDKYQAMTRQLDLERRVYFTGPRPVDALGFYLRQADILVSPRVEGENTPMKIYSYLDSGRPVLATRIASHTQVLDEAIAVLVEPEPEDLAAGLAELLQNERKGQILAQRAREKVAEQFSRPVFERKLLGFYGALGRLLADRRNR
jgi:glycosyltransferase involved in cell wall biosynthesis